MKFPENFLYGNKSLISNIKMQPGNRLHFDIKKNIIERILQKKYKKLNIF